MMPDEDFEVTGINVSSGVSDQPMTDEETRQGALNRAKNAMKSYASADFWVGIEGGIEEQYGEMLAFAWVVILSKHQQGQSRTSTFSLPPAVTQLIHQGIELGHANDQVFDEHNSKTSGGAVGTLTKGILDRTAYYVQPVLLALVPFINGTMFPKKN